MLIKCPECELQVSDKAVLCPHCGYPLKPEATRIRKPRSNKRKRLPNGFGQISEIKGRALRKPFRAMVTVGKTQEGRPICKLLKPESYFETYNDAYQALMEYNKNPFDFSKDITVSELYDRWSAEFYPKRKSIATYKSAWKYCSSIANLKVSEVRTHHVRYCMEHGTVTVKGSERTPTFDMQRYIKMLLSLMFKYAILNEITDKNPAAIVTLETKTDDEIKSHINFTNEEMKKLKAAIGKVEHADLLYVDCYSGWRPTELCELLLENVDLDKMTFTGGKKTKSGTNRVVPIHPNIQEIVKQHYAESRALGSKYLFSAPRDKSKHDYFIYYAKYLDWFQLVCKTLEFGKHSPHDCRVQFVTMAKQYDVNEYAIKYLVGHSIKDLTERVYTKRTNEWLRTEIEKIK